MLIQFFVSLSAFGKGLNRPVRGHYQRCKCRVRHPWGLLLGSGGGTGSGQTGRREPNEPPALTACCPPVRRGWLVTAEVTCTLLLYSGWCIETYSIIYLAIKFCGLVSLNADWVLGTDSHSGVICTFVVGLTLDLEYHHWHHHSLHPS